jgi:glucokinase
MARRVVGDIGGTNARFALVGDEPDDLHEIEVLPTADYPLFLDALRDYLGRRALAGVESICLAVAGPVELDLVDLPNNHWTFSRRELAGQLGIPVRVINDFSAQVLGIATLSDQELSWVGEPRPRAPGIIGVVGPGTGLGVAALFPSGEILPSEGGHSAFAPTTDHQSDLLRLLRGRFERVSAERVLSGPGLANLYWANCRLARLDRELPAPEVTAGAQAGDPHCLQSVADFFDILAAFSGDFALTAGATAGLYLSGGILPKISSMMDSGRFRSIFDDKGRMTELVSGIPLALVLAEHPGLRGCASALAEGSV